MGRNIEIKARATNLDGLREAAARRGAACEGLLEQTDTYFHAAQGRLKLRETVGAEAQLVAYHRGNAAEVRASDYTLVAAPEPAHLKRALASTLGVRAVVTKRRELWLWRNVRIHLDTVAGLGCFLELEAVVGDEFNDEQSRAHLEELLRAFGISPADVLAESYVDLLADMDATEGGGRSQCKMQNAK